MAAAEDVVPRVLIVEDETKMANLLRRGLEKEGMAVDVEGRGDEAVWRAGATEYDAIVLDLMLPGIDGFEVCDRLRAAEVWSPILMLTARDSVADRVAGLDRGADDYLTKPFSYAELLARLRALIRRGRPERPTQLEAGGLRLDPATHRVWRQDTEISLSANDEGELRDAIGSSIEEVDRLIQLAEDLLVVARSEQGGLSLTSERVAVAELLARIRERFSARAAQLNRELVVDAPGELVADGDRLRLEQALMNIVDNALRYGEGVVRMEAEAKDGRVVMRVTDSGPGFPDGFAERAFERFATADPARGRGGSGLGLAIVATIVSAHGGSFGAGNGGGGGAEVWIEVAAAS